MASEQDLRLMRLAIQAAREGQRTPGGECVGAVLAYNGEAASAGFNEGESRHDPTAHAEMVVIRRLCETLKSTSLEGYTIYCTLQPCGMCTMACVWAGISRIVYGAGRDEVPGARRERGGERYDGEPGRADERDRAKFAKAQSYMVRREDMSMCKNIRCRKRFEVAGVQSVAFLND